jgi:hypothetical protein
VLESCDLHCVAQSPQCSHENAPLVDVVRDLRNWMLAGAGEGVVLAIGGGGPRGQSSGLVKWKTAAERQGSTPDLLLRTLRRLHALGQRGTAISSSSSAAAALAHDGGGGGGGGAAGGGGGGADGAGGAGGGAGAGAATPVVGAPQLVDPRVVDLVATMYDVSVSTAAQPRCVRECMSAANACESACSCTTPPL